MPAASSEAELIRLPDAKRSIAFSIAVRLPARILEAEIEETFVFATTPTAMFISFVVRRD
jgi:hypothetical protein